MTYPEIRNKILNLKNVPLHEKDILKYLDSLDLSKYYDFVQRTRKTNLHFFEYGTITYNLNDDRSIKTIKIPKRKRGLKYINVPINLETYKIFINSLLKIREGEIIEHTKQIRIRNLKENLLKSNLQKYLNENYIETFDVHHLGEIIEFDLKNKRGCFFTMKTEVVEDMIKNKDYTILDKKIKELGERL